MTVVDLRNADVEYFSGIGLRYLKNGLLFMHDQDTLFDSPPFDIQDVSGTNAGMVEHFIAVTARFLIQRHACWTPKCNYTHRGLDNSPISPIFNSLNKAC
jgi:hypothetical protein